MNDSLVVAWSHVVDIQIDLAVKLIGFDGINVDITHEFLLEILYLPALLFPEFFQPL